MQERIQDAAAVELMRINFTYLCVFIFNSGGDRVDSLQFVIE